MNYPIVQITWASRHWLATNGFGNMWIRTMSSDIVTSPPYDLTMKDSDITLNVWLQDTSSMVLFAENLSEPYTISYPLACQS